MQIKKVTLFDTSIIKKDSIKSFYFILRYTHHINTVMKEPIVPIGMVMQHKFKRKLGETNRIEINK